MGNSVGARRVGAGHLVAGQGRVQRDHGDAEPDDEAGRGAAEQEAGRGGSYWGAADRLWSTPSLPGNGDQDQSCRPA